MSVSAFVLIKMANFPRSVAKEGKEVKNNLKSINEVESVYLLDTTNSSYDVIAKISANSINSLYNIILGRIAKSPGVKETTTMIVMDS